jgi:hypothetical protein
MSIEAASTNSSYLSSGLSSAAYFDAKLSFARGVDALQAVAAEKFVSNLIHLLIATSHLFCWNFVSDRTFRPLCSLSACL